MAAVGDTGISIRAARAGDAAALTSLSAELGYPGDERQVEQRFGWIARDPRQRIFVATDAAGAVVGWVHVNFGRWLVVNPRGEVMGLVVSSAMRGQGIGRQLMNAAETWTREQGGTVLTLRSNIVRKEAHAFYERLGYKVTKTSLNFSKNV